MIEENNLDDIKTITLTKKEALYLSDNISLMMELPRGSYQTPARALFGSARIAVPLEIVEKIGFAVLITTEPGDLESGNGFARKATLEFSVSELLILRECCDSSYQDIGLDLIRKIYSLILEKDFSEIKLVQNLTKDIMEF